MGLILFHTARSEDFFLQSALQNKPQIWETGKWYQKLNMAETASGAHFSSVDEVNTFPVPNIKDLLDYYEAVRASSLSYLSSLSPEEFNRTVKLPFGDFNLAGIFSLVVNHTAGHIGEISYLRGMLRGMDK
jgi:hypothetical protein